MKRSRRKAVRPTLEDTPFSKLVAVDRDLAKLRRQYQNAPSSERRKAADWEYHAACAADIFGRAVGECAGGGWWDGYATALAIDPEYGPAMLTVGSVEYQLGRVDEAMALFLRLIALENEESLPEIIDKAGDFLIDQDDLENAERLYAAAAAAHPQVAIYHIGLGYCAGKAQRFEEAVEHTRHAVELEPDNYLHLTDFGYSLIEAGEYDEAERVLKRAVRLAPPDYELAKGNLQYLNEVRP